MGSVRRVTYLVLGLRSETGLGGRSVPRISRRVGVEYDKKGSV